MENAANADLDAVFDLLSKTRCRYTMYYVLENTPTTVGRLSGQIAAWESETDIQSVTESEKQPITISLLHNHLPRLADHGIIEFDQRSGDIVTADGFAAVRDLVERARSRDDRVDVETEPTDTVLYSTPLEEVATSSTSRH